MNDSKPTVKTFLEELTKINGNGNAETVRKATVTMLEKADALYNEPAFQEIVNDEDFRKKISGSAYLVETFNGRHERPVIDLVQQGGVMLGIGLVGYTYIMEKAGLRFRSMAGTSAGAINTLLMAALPEEIYREPSPLFDDKKRQATKSEFLAYIISKKDFIVFLERNDFAGKLQKLVIKKINSFYKIRKWLTGGFIAVFFLLAAGMMYLLTSKLFTAANGVSNSWIRIYDFLAATTSTFALLLIILGIIFSFFRKTMGFNSGAASYQWMTDILRTTYVKVHTTKDLENRKANETDLEFNRPKLFELEEEVPPGYQDARRVVFITANLTHNRVVKFPERRADYWDDEFADLVNPAAYVRASMSLPFIYDAFIPGDEHVSGWSHHAKPQTVVSYARFVDGGMLSNFPIREFHVPRPSVPRFPTFGVLLGTPQKNAGKVISLDKFKNISVFRYVLSFISTFRRFYDDDFLRTNKEVQHLVENVDTSKFNAMDFNMSDITKQKLFVEGAKAAIRQLKKFTWSEYLNERVPAAKKAEKTGKKGTGNQNNGQ